MGRIYTVPFENVSVTAIQDFFEILPATQKPVRLLGGKITNVGGTADAGDAQEELLRTTVKRGHTTSGSGGTAPTPVKNNPDDAAAGLTAEVNNTTIASVGTAVILDTPVLNVRIGAEFWYTPETAPWVKNAELLVWRLEAAPADAISLSGVLYLEEI